MFILLFLQEQVIIIISQEDIPFSEEYLEVRKTFSNVPFVPVKCDVYQEVIKN